MERLREPIADRALEAAPQRRFRRGAPAGSCRRRTGRTSALPAPWLLVLIVASACSQIRVAETAVPEPSSSSSETPAPTTSNASMPTDTMASTLSTSAGVTATTVASTEPAVPATAAPAFTAPFTGLPTSTEIVRPAAVVKIDNHPKALPQWGINAADVVYEELVEARLTRFAAIFHSADADVVGPVRSARTGDFGLLSNLNQPIFVNSGANDYTARALRNVDAINITDGGWGAEGVFERSSDKHAPHNLVTDTDRIFAAGAERGGTPPAYFRFRDAGEALQQGAAASGVDISFGQIEASYRWDAALGGWARTQNGNPHTDFDGVRVAPENVIVQFVRYRQSPANAATPEPVLTGGGEAWIFSDGRLVRGTWERLSELDVTTFRSDNALIVPLTPGRTWIALAREGTAEVIR